MRSGSFAIWIEEKDLLWKGLVKLKKLKIICSVGYDTCSGLLGGGRCWQLLVVGLGMMPPDSKQNSEHSIISRPCPRTHLTGVLKKMGPLR